MRLIDRFRLVLRRNKIRGNVDIGNNFDLGHNNLITTSNIGKISVGSDVIICDNCRLLACDGKIAIGKNVQIGDYNYITGQGNVTIEDNVLFASNVSIIANGHNYKNINVPIMQQGEIPKKVIIGAGSWIGINVTILGESVIGKNCVVAAGSVVKGEFPDYCVIGGIPAKVLQSFDSKKGEWVRNR